MKNYYVYILANASRSLYVGVTTNLTRRVWEHKQRLVQGFTRKYKLTELVYYEIWGDVRSAIAREKEIKGWRRLKKTKAARIGQSALERSERTLVCHGPT